MSLNNKTQKKIPEVCRKYIRGTCKLPFCRFLHLKTTPAITNYNWALAPEFFPRNHIKYATNLTEPNEPIFNESTTTRSYADVLFKGIDCPCYLNCPYEMCAFCGEFALHVSARYQRLKHLSKCMEKEMEYSFMVASSENKRCGICLESMWRSTKGKGKRFGILSECNHVFCLECIRKWRNTKREELDIDFTSCPECRTTSDLICPSNIWVHIKEEKDKLFHNYQSALNKKKCRYFNNGFSECLFGTYCFYQHIQNGRRVYSVVQFVREVTLEGCLITTDLSDD